MLINSTLCICPGPYQEVSCRVAGSPQCIPTAMYIMFNEDLAEWARQTNGRMGGYIRGGRVVL